jgi:hypothetical protein
MKTAVEFLLEKYKSQNTLLFAEDFEQAVAMEKEQIINAFHTNSQKWFCNEEAEQYYNQTFKQPEQ